MKKLFTILAAVLILVGFGLADWRYNPFTGKLDYYEAGFPTPGAVGDIVYYDGAAWQVLTAGANGLVLTLNTGLPTWMAGAGADVLVGIDAAAAAGYLGAASNDGVLRTGASIGYVDGGNFITLSVSEANVDHDSLQNYVAGQHLVLPNTIATVLSDWDADLDTYAGITPSADVQGILGAATYAAMRTLLDLEVGVDFPALAHTMASHSDDDTYSISTSGDATIDHAALGGAVVDADIGLGYSKLLTDTDNSIKAGAYIVPQFTKTTADYTNTAIGVYGQGILDATNDQDWSHGIGLRGVMGMVSTETSSTGTILGAASFISDADVVDAATVTNLYGLYILTPTVAGSKVTNEYGIYVANQDSGLTLNYAIYTGTGLVRFGDVLHADGGIVGPAAALDINTDVIQNVNLWATIPSGNPVINVGGWDTEKAGGAGVVLTAMGFEDTNNEFHITTANDTGHEGVAVVLAETNQMFRIRQNADALQFYHDGTDAYIHTTDGQIIFDTDEAAAAAMIGLTEADGTHKIYLAAPVLAADVTLTLPIDDGDAGEQLQTNGAGVLSWEAAGAGATTFLALTDTPGAFVANNLVANNGAGNALEFLPQVLQSANGLIFTHATDPVLEFNVNASTDQHYIEAITEAGLANTGMRIILNEDASNNSIPIAVVGEADRAVDLAMAAVGNPQLNIYTSGAATSLQLQGGGKIDFDGTNATKVMKSGDSMLFGANRYYTFNTSIALSLGNWMTFNPASLSDTDGRQAVLYTSPIINQVNAETGAAGYEIIKIRVTETDIDTAALNWLVDLGTTATVFGILRDGKIATNQAVANTNTPSGATVQAMPIYDAAGTLLGYIPVYAAVW